MPSDQQDSYLFGNYRLCLKTRELYHGKKPVAIENKTFDFLSCLLIHHDRVVLKEELQKTLWNNRPISESALSRYAMKARRAIDDDGQAQSKIKTVSGRGFRYVGKVKYVEYVESEKHSSPAAPGTRSNRLVFAKISGVRFIVTIGVIIFTATLGLVISEKFIINKPEMKNFSDVFITTREQTESVLLLPLIQDDPHSSVSWPENLLIESIDHYLSLGNIYAWKNINISAYEYPSHSPALIVDWARKQFDVENSYIFIGKLRSDNNIYSLDYELHHTNNKASKGRLIDLDASNLAQILAKRIRLHMSQESSDTTQKQYNFHDPEASDKYQKAFHFYRDKQYIEAIGLYKEILDQEDSHIVKLKLAEALLRTGDLDQSEEYLLSILAIVKSSEKHDINLTTLTLLAEIKGQRGEYREAKRLYEDAMDLARGVDNERRANSILTNIGKLEAFLGKYDVAENLLNTALSRSRALGDLEGEAASLAARGYLAFIQGKITPAKKLTKQAFDIYRSLIDDDNTNECLVLMAKILDEGGLQAESSMFLREAVRRTDDSSSHKTKLKSLIALAKLKQDQGHFRYSLNLLEEASLLNGTGAESIATLEISLLQNRALAFHEDFDLEPLTSLRDRARGDGWHRTVSEISYEIGSILLKRHDLEGAKSETMLIDKLSTKINNLDLRSKSLRLKANIEHAKGNLDRADHFYHQALVLADSLGSRKMATEITIDLLYLSLQNGQTVKADVLQSTLQSLEKYHRAIAADAYYLYKKGNFKAALARYREATILTKESWRNSENTLHNIYQEAAATGVEKPVGFIDLLLSDG